MGALCSGVKNVVIFWFCSVFCLYAYSTHPALWFLHTPPRRCWSWDVYARYLAAAMQCVVKHAIVYVLYNVVVEYWYVLCNVEPALATMQACTRRSIRMNDRNQSGSENGG